MTEYFLDLFAYDTWANRQWLNVLREAAPVEERTRHLCAHIPAAKKIWMARLQGEYTGDLALWPDPSWAECEALISESDAAYRAYLQALSGDDLVQPVTYENSKGTEFNTPVRDILMHVVTHGNYHRGQIAQAARRQGLEPVNTDYITYVRRS